MPALKPARPPDRKHSGWPEGAGSRQPTNQWFRPLFELRARTLRRVPDDPLAKVDWWALVFSHPIEHVARSRHRGVREARLPSGLWSIRTALTAEADYGVHIRFEGYAPWWENASDHAWETAFRFAVPHWSGWTGEVIPKTDATEYVDRPAPAAMLEGKYAVTLRRLLKLGIPTSPEQWERAMARIAEIEHAAKAAEKAKQHA